MAIARVEAEKDLRRAADAWENGDLQLALSLFQKCAEGGDRTAQLNLGYFFDTGLGTTADKERAYYWYHKAYSGGDSSAASNIAILHREQGSARKAVWWFRKAVVMGDGDALLELARCYANGYGMRRNAERALALFRQAVACGNITEYGQEQAREEIKKAAKGRSKTS